MDSAFSSLRQLSFDVAKRGAAAVPGPIVGAALRWVRGSVLGLADFDLYDVAPLDHAPEVVSPALVLCAADDVFVEPAHSHAIHAALGCVDKELCVCPGAHNTARPIGAYVSIEGFLRRALGDGEAKTAFADVVDRRLAILLSPARRPGRPNFAALPPWTVENLTIRARQRERPIDDFAEADDVSEASAEDGAAAAADAPTTPRWLREEAAPAHDDTVAAMQEETARVARLLG